MYYFCITAICLCAYDTYIPSSLFQALATIWHLVLYFIIFGAYLLLTFMKAVIFILKHATFLHLSIPSQKLSLTQAEKDYMAANIELKIQKFLTPSSQELSVEKLAQFIMANDIGLLFLHPLLT